MFNMRVINVFLLRLYIGFSETLILINSYMSVKWHNKSSLHVVTDQSK